MVVLKDITWEEFQKIIGMLEFYRERGTEGLDSMITVCKDTKKQHYNIEVPLEKEGFREMIACVDAYNVLKECKFDKGIEKIGSKLYKAFFKEYGEEADIEHLDIDKFGVIMLSPPRDENDPYGKKTTLIREIKAIPKIFIQQGYQHKKVGTWVRKDEYERWKKYLFAESDAMKAFEASFKEQIRDIPREYRIDYTDGSLMGIKPDWLEYIQREIFGSEIKKVKK